MKRALIAMSGGVDSSVAALLCQQKGYECVGATMLLCGNEDTGVSDARDVCRRLGMDFHVLDLRKSFREKIIDSFVKSYEKGETPNPCVECNKNIKFGEFFSFADELKCDYIATGHYARVLYKDGRYYIRKGLDERKDQSYVLWTLSQSQLSRVLFPLGEITKDEVREAAEQAGFVNSSKKESQDICFVPDGDYARVIEEYAKKTYPCGNFVLKNGEVIGQHKGIIRYTVGQRRGLGLSLSEPLYVAEKRAESNEVVLCRDEELFSDTLTARDCNFMADLKVKDAFRCSAKIRYNQKEEGAHAVVCDGGKVKVTFDRPQRAAAKGQSLVIYDGDTVLGGGVIE